MAVDRQEASLFEVGFADYENEYDPLMDEGEEWDEDERAELFGYIGDPGDLAPASEVPPASPKTAQQTINDLFASMVPFKRYFLAIMDFCREPRSLESVESFVGEMQAHRKSVYTATSFCRMLAEADALEKITEDGEPYCESDVEPEEVKGEDGIIYLKPATPPAVFWRTTDEGCRAIEEDNPTEVLLGIIADKSRYESVFLEILHLCDSPDGISISEIKSRVNDNPVLADPPKTAQFFMDYLDRNGAIVWEGKWKTTDIGKSIVTLLDA